jgi:hypothetical protein
MSDRPKNHVVLLVLAVILIAACFVAGFLLIPRQFADQPLPPLPSPPLAETKPEVGPETGIGTVVAPPPREPGTVYQADFASMPGEEWNLRLTSTTEKGQRPFLGKFSPDDRPALTLKALPPHKLVRVSFDLFLFRSWDGSHPSWGPGLWDMKVGGEDGRTLVHSTFCNCGFFSDNNEQTFPDSYPARPYPAWTLATENQTLGTIQDWGGPDRTFDASAVYHMVMSFPHTAADVAFEFQSTLPDNPNKPYGLTNMKVEALPELATFTAAELDQLWKDLGAADPKTFYEARWKLISAGDAASECIGKRYRDLTIPAHPTMTAPGGNVLPYPMEAPVIHRERARWVLEAIHTPAALALKKEIPTVIEK